MILILKENMEARQIVFLMVMFIFGSSIIMGVNSSAKQDTWISILVAIIMALPMVLIYARIIKLNPGESLFDISEKLFGKIIGKIIIVLVTWYAIHLGTMVLCNFEKYIEITSLLNTPEILVAGLMVFVTIYIGKSSITTLGKWSSFVLPIVISIVVLTIIMATGSLDVNNILPIMGHSPSTIVNGSINIFSFPFAETVLLLCLGCFFKKEDSPYKIYISGLLIGGIILIIVFLRNITILGVGLVTETYFPSYAATRIIEFGDFLTRVEGAITINFVLAGITKIAVCLIAATKGISKLFNVKNYKDLIVPTGVMILTLCTFLYSSVLQMFGFIKVYPIYAFPFQVIIPIIIWIASEINVRKKSNVH